MRRLALAALFTLAAGACIGGGANEQTVLVDFSHDEFASTLIANFPKRVEVLPGDTLVFKQVWTGEAHTVTGGTLVNDTMSEAKNFLPLFEANEGLMAAGVDLPKEGENPDEPFADVLRIVEESDVEPHRTNFLKNYDAKIEPPAGGSPEIRRTIEAFSARLRDQVDLETLGHELRGTVSRTLQPAHLNLLLRGPGGALEWQWTYRGRRDQARDES